MLNTTTQSFTTVGTPTDIDDLNITVSAPRKVIENGHVFILMPDGTRYSATGAKVK